MQATFLKRQQTMAQKVKCNLCSCISFMIALLLLSVTVEGQTSTDPKLTLRHLFEEALLNSNESLDTLQQLFFNSSTIRSPVSVCIWVHIYVDYINIQKGREDYCYANDQSYDGYAAFHCYESTKTECPSGWYFASGYKLELADDEGGTAQLSDLLTNSGSTGTFFIFDPSFYTIMEGLSASIDHTFSFGNIPNVDPDNPASIVIHISEDLQQMPCRSEADDALRMVLVWAKAYAREHGRPYVKLDVDRSLVSFVQDDYICSTQYFHSNSLIGSDDNSLIDPDNTGIYFLFVFILSDLLFLSAVLFYFRNMFLWLQQQGKHTKSLYKASAIVLTCVNIVLLISDIDLLINVAHYNRSTSDFVIDTVSCFKAPLILIIMIIETPLICYYTHGVNNVCYRIAHAFALCQIIWFGHRLVTDAIISIVFFVIAPAQTLGVVTLLLSVIASAIAFVAIILHKGFTGCNKKYCIFLFCASLNGIMLCVLLFLITLLFIIFVDNGLKSAGMGGLILSLVIAFAGAVFGLFVQQKFFRSTTSTASVNTPTEPQETHQTTAIQIVNETETHPLLRRPQA